MPRRRFRDGDAEGMKILALVLRQKVIAGALWTLLGGTVTAGVMRVFLVSQLNAQATDIKTNREAIARWARTTDSLRNGMLVLTKSACLDRTPGEQALAGMDCPPELYKGVLQGAIRGTPAP